jgi:pyruvate dehydrogenase E2 component (dihydrolipoamide acetyltransferase)
MEKMINYYNSFLELLNKVSKDNPNFVKSFHQFFEITEEKPIETKQETQKQETKQIQQEKIQKTEEVKKEKSGEKEKPVEEQKEKKKEPQQPLKPVKGTASPAAKKLAAQLNVDIEKLQEEGKIPAPAHEKDVLMYFYSKNFTDDALQELKEYDIDIKEVVEELGENITKEKLIKYLKEKGFYKTVEISQIQKRLIQHLEKSTGVPVYHIYETLDIKYINHNENYTLTTYLVKIFADVMQNHYRTRIYYDNGKYRLYPSSNIAIAVAVDEELFSPVIKNASEKSLKEIQEDINQIKNKAKSKNFKPEDFEGGTFAISNLGMFGIEMFDAVIPYNYSGIAAIGTEEKKKIKIVITFDHRIINGKEAALFVKELKEKFKDKKYIEGLS